MASKLILTRSRLAEALGIHVMTVSRWTMQGLPVHEHGRGRESKYDLPAVIQWVIARQIAQGVTNDGPGGLAGGPADLVAERARLTKAQTVKALMGIQLERGELVLAEKVHQAWGDVVHAIRSALLALPQSISERCVAAVGQLPGLGPVVEPVRVKAIAAVQLAARDQVHDCLRALAQWPGKLPTERRPT